MLDKKDIDLLEWAKEKWLDLDWVIESAKVIVSQNELKTTLQNIKYELDYKFNEVLENHIEEITKLDDEQKLDFIFKKAFELYKKDIDSRNFEEKRRLDEEKKMNKIIEEKEQE